MVTDITANKPHEVAELICLGCHSRWIGAYHGLLKDAVCECGAKGLIIKTGQTIEEESNEWVKY